MCAGGGFCVYRSNYSEFLDGSLLVVGISMRKLTVRRCDITMKLNELDIFDIIDLIGNTVGGIGL